MSEEVDEGLVERVAAAIQAVVASEFSRNRAATHHDGARAAIAAMREAGWIAPPSSWHNIRASLDAGANESIVSAVERVLTERDREKTRADRAEAALEQERETRRLASAYATEKARTVAQLERELREVRERAERAEAYGHEQNKYALRLESKLRELREQQTPITVPLELTGNVAAEWAKMQERLAALEQRLGALNYEGVLSSFQQLMDRVTKLEQPQPPSAPAQPTTDAASSDAAVGMLTEKLNAHRYQPFTPYMVQRLLAGVGLHVWSGDVTALCRDLGKWSWSREKEPLWTVLARHGLIQATADDREI